MSDESSNFEGYIGTLVFNNIVRQMVEGEGYESDIVYTYNGVPVELCVQLLSIGGIKTPAHPEYEPSEEDDD